MSVFNGTTSNFIVKVSAIDIAESITDKKVVSCFKEACDIQERNDQPMSEAEVSETVSILKGYWETFSSYKTFDVYAKKILVDGKMSFDINLQSVLSNIILNKGWSSCDEGNKKYCFVIRNNKIIKIYLKTINTSYYCWIII